HKGRRVKLEEAAGEISCEFLCPYPPGVTLLAPGEEITREILETVCRFKQLGFNWQGPSDPLLNTLLVL
ncbi:MAG: decarboxylase, partial [Syntrophomonadaceae bacterium]|nr:decarboxylase [Syntrophomonadaceae bacterium]